MYQTMLVIKLLFFEGFVYIHMHLNNESFCIFMYMPLLKLLFLKTFICIYT